MDLVHEESKKGLSPDQKKDLIEKLNSFAQWLKKKKIVKKLYHFDDEVEMPFASEDWFMKADPKRKTVSFNTHVSEKCTYEYYMSIVLHEFFHLEVQKVPNKEDAVKLRDDFGNELLKLIDIEADFYTASFFKEVLNYNLVDYLKLYYEGSKVFSDGWIRTIKLERFIGTLLSISRLHMINGNAKDPPCDLYLPTISPIYTEETLHVLVVKKEHIHFDEIKASYNDFKSIKECYTNIDTLTSKGYIERLISFAAKAFGIETPKDIQIDIDNIVIE